MDTNNSWKFVCILILILSVKGEEVKNKATVESDGKDSEERKLYKVEGVVDIDGVDISVWGPRTRVLVDSGKYIGYLKASGEFQIVNIPSGSYTVEVVSPNHIFESVRIDISGKTGKIRARKLNLLKPNAVASLSYPLKFQTTKRAEFFQKRESFNILSMLKNPMVLLMLAPILLMVVMPKLMNSMDKDTQKEMQQSMKTFQQPGGSNMPSLEEMFTNFFGGGGSSSKKTNKSIGAKKTKH